MWALPEKAQRSCQLSPLMLEGAGPRRLPPSWVLGPCRPCPHPWVNVHAGVGTLAKRRCLSWLQARCRVLSMSSSESWWVLAGLPTA